MKNNILLCIAGLIVAACHAQQTENNGVSAPETAAIGLTPVAETTVTLTDGASDPAILIDGTNPERSRILGAGQEGGLELYALDGTRVGVMSDRPIGLVDVLYNFPLGEASISLILAYDVAAAEILAYRIGDGGSSLSQITASPMRTGMEAEGLCGYRSPVSGKFYAFALGAGWLQQWELQPSGGGIEGRMIRRLPVGLGAAHCVVDHRSMAIYFSQETVGVWALNAEPEAETEATLIDLTHPHGRYQGDVKGVAIVASEAGGGYLLVSDADVSLLHVHDLESHAHQGAFSVVAGASIGGADEVEGMAATGMRLSDDYGDGLLILTDDDNDGEHTNYKMLAWRDVSTALNLPDGVAHNPTISAPPSAIIVTPSVETTPVESYGDAADDAAFWVHPEHPELSTVIGSQKQHGIHVYDLDGSLIESRADGRINNVDIRYGFELDGRSIDIVTGSNRSSDSISIYAIDLKSRTLVDVADGVIATGMADPYGLCMYKSPRSGEFFVFVNDTDGLVRQWQLQDNGAGRVGASLVREFGVGSQTEGCVTDDATGDLYIGEENVAIWKYSAEPDGGDTRIRVDGIEDGNLAGDIEGLAIFYGPGGSGYLLASDQGIDSYAVYERAGDNQYLGHFRVLADAATGIDGASETDGLDVTGARLGPQFPQGAFVVQDGRNITPAERQNFKLTPWERIAAAMGLESNPDYDPRAPAE